jgi:hypothetical protein
LVEICAAELFLNDGDGVVFVGDVGGLVLT